MGSADPPFLTTTFGGGQGFAVAESEFMELAFVESDGVPAVEFKAVGAVEQSATLVFL